jgi:hypothetical protein
MTICRNKQRQYEWRYTFYLSKARFSGLCLDEEGRSVTTKSAARAVEERERLAACQKQTWPRAASRSAATRSARLRRST